MSRSLSEIDADLSSWMEIVARMGKSIEGLTQDPTYLRLKAQSRIGALLGATKERAEATVSAAEQLWTLYLTLDKLLLEASELRRSSNPFGREDRLEKIDTILTGKTADLPAQPVGLAQMSLAGISDRRASFREVFTAMDAGFNYARDTVIAASKGWSHALDLSCLRDKISAIKAEAGELGCPCPPLLEDASKLLDTTTSEIENDPIGAVDAAEEVSSMISKAGDALASARRDFADARAFLASAEARLSDLIARYAHATGLRSDRMAKISEPMPAVVLPADPVDELRTWLTTLTQTVTDGRPRAALVGAKSWTARADRALDDINSVVNEDQALLDLRLDLRGRFSALTAKAEFRKAQGQLTPEIATLFGQARELLFGGPTPMPEAVALMHRCELV